VTLLVKDANTTTQPLSTGLDSSGNLVPMHTPAAIVGGIATPVSIAAPLPVINTAAAAAVDGSGTVNAGGTAKVSFDTVPLDWSMKMFPISSAAIHHIEVTPLRIVDGM